MAFGEMTIRDWTADNVANVTFLPNQVAVLDTTNSVGQVVAAALPAAAHAQPLGVVVDKTHLNAITGTPDPGQGVALRSHGMAFCIAAGTINVGDMVEVANSSGQVQSLTRAAAGAQPGPIVGRALSGTTTVGNTVLVLLMIGGTF